MSKMLSMTLLLGLPALAALLMAAVPTRASRRDRAEKASQQGNYKDAYEGYRALALDPEDDRARAGEDLKAAIECLGPLGRVDEADDFRDAVLAAHPKDWRLLMAAAQTLADGEHFGFIVAGKFSRGGHRGGGRYVTSAARDRNRALQLLSTARELSKDDPDHAAVATLHLEFARILLNEAGANDQGWRLQRLTDLGDLPDYEEGYGGFGGNPGVGAPVDSEGRPVYFHLPKGYEVAKDDGERWRWMLARAEEIDPARRAEARSALARVFWHQFGVHTMQGAGLPGAEPDGDGKRDESGPFAVHTLGEDETIARLATGNTRFALPDEFNFLKIYREVAEGEKGPFGEDAYAMLARIFQDRRQFPKAAATLKQAIDRYGPGPENSRQKQLDQIVGNWGEFQPEPTQPAGRAATLGFRFRNGKQAHFEAHEVRVEALLGDVRAYLKARPAQPDWNKINLADLGSRLVEQDERQYLGARVAAWDLDLDPRPDHFDRRMTVETPLKKAGAYLVTARMAGGNVGRVLVWVADTTLVKKPMKGGWLYFVADAITGAPIPKANVEFLGWRQEPVDPQRGVYRTVTENFAEFSDADGRVTPNAGAMRPDCQWVAVARTGDGRLAFLGFSYAWTSGYAPGQYDQTKVFLATDRPVYRPDQVVKFKFWLRQARYEGVDEALFAGKPFLVKLNNPKGETVYQRTFTTDAFGGLDGEYAIPKDATLGAYVVFIDRMGGGSFRVEEYKKPEFEVKVDAPAEPIRLGETVEATLRAKYYFGAPVTEAKVSYKVTRTSYEHSWFPRGRWDWLYDPGYGWLVRESAWYPGWSSWGGPGARFPWLFFGHQPPEVVAQAEVPIGHDGTVKIKIDTAAAKAAHPDQDHRYEITAEVVDASRRTIVGSGSVLVARKPFKVFAWLDRGYYRAGQDVEAQFSAQSLDGKPIKGKGKLTLLKVAYADGKPVETPAQTWDLDTDDQGRARLQLKAAEAGQYRLAYTLTDAKDRTEEGGYLFVVRGEGFDGRQFRFNDLELIADKREYAPGETVRLMVNANKANGTVLLFVRAVNGVVLPPEVIRLDGKSTVREIGVAKGDMPNFFVEALTVADGKVHDEVAEIIVPPEKRTLNVEVVPSREIYKPGAPAKIKVKLTDLAGKPFVGSTTLTMYDKALEYIAGGSNVPEIRAFFWKWRRQHNAQTESSLDRGSGNLVRSNEVAMEALGVLGPIEVQRVMGGLGGGRGETSRMSARGGAKLAAAPAASAPAPMGAEAKSDVASDLALVTSEAPPDASAAMVQPTVRKVFADAALWVAALTTDKDGLAEVGLTMPENLTGWKVRAWAMGRGTEVGEGEAEVTTAKDLLIRMQAPRFFVQTDEVVLSANVHNYLKVDKDVQAVLELDGGVLSPLGAPTQAIRVPAGGEKRVDWRVRVQSEGEAVVRMKALSDEESDAMEMRFPALVHGMAKTDSFSGAIRPDADHARLTFRIPDARRKGDTRVEIRYSPTLAGAMVDAIPYLANYPYGCTEQTLNRFLPTVIAQGVLRRMGVDLKALQKARTNLNPQEVGDAAARAAQWKKYDRNPVFDEAEVQAMVREGLKDLAAMQLSDGGWGWFSGSGEHADAHMTSIVVHGLQVARASDVAIVPGVLERGIEWLKRYQAEQVRLIRNAATETKPFKPRADDLDAFVYLVLAGEDLLDREMLGFLDRDRPHLSVYGLTMLGRAAERQKQADVLARTLRNLEQYLVKDAENQTAYLRLPETCPWWAWYGSETETQASYLKLLARTDPKGETAPALVKYLLNNRKHATYWNSTRDTALCVEAMADYLAASGEDRPDMTVSIAVDGQVRKEVKIDASNLFGFDNALVLAGDEVASGEHAVEVTRKGRGPVYFNAYVSYFTLEDPIRRTGLEVKVNRKLYKVIPAEGTAQVPGSRGQVLDQRVGRDRREELNDGSTLKSGDVVEIELEIDSKNDYEYLAFEDMKAAGFEPVEVRSGYNGNDLGAYMELRDQKVCFFARTLARGKHSVRYRLRAEIPGKFSALPTLGYGMYAPELRGNSDEAKVAIED